MVFIKRKTFVQVFNPLEEVLQQGSVREKSFNPQEQYEAEYDRCGDTID